LSQIPNPRVQPTRELQADVDLLGASRVEWFALAGFLLPAASVRLGWSLKCNSLAFPKPIK
jgi:hypothetical protein